MKTIGRYNIIEKLGTGSMGTVYLAHDPILDRNVALKVLLSKFLDTQYQTIRDRFVREAKILAKLDHPNIVRVIDILFEEDKIIISMEYVKGKNLRDFLTANPNLSYKQKVDLAVQIARGLEAIHKLNLIHRDLKPANILISTAGQIKIMDFGISKNLDQQMTHSNEFLGTPAYMSPEQVANGAIDHRSDIFAFGVILYELFFSTNPFVTNSVHGTFENILKKISKKLIFRQGEFPILSAK